MEFMGSGAVREGSVGRLVKHRSLTQPGLFLARQLSAGPCLWSRQVTALRYCWGLLLPPISAVPLSGHPPGRGCVDFQLNQELCSNLLHVGQWEVGASRQEAIGLCWSASHCSREKNKKKSSKAPKLFGLLQDMAFSLLQMLWSPPFKAWNSSCLKSRRGWDEGIHSSDPMMYLNLKEKEEKTEINPNLYCFYLVAGLTEHLQVVAFSVCGSMHIYSESTETLTTNP